MGLTQDQIGTVIDEENKTKYRSIYVGLCSKCEQCRFDYGIDTEEEFEELENKGKLFDEGGFSWHDCELCKSPLGGNRFAAHGIDENDDILHYSICQDCVEYLSN